MKSHFTAMRAVFIKDVKLLWPLMLLCAGLFLARALLPAPAARLAETLSTAANLILIVVVIHLDAPASRHLDWLTRPIAPVALLAEKLAFLLVALLLPSMAADLLQGRLLITDHYLALAMVLPVMAAAALTTRLIAAALLALGVAALNAIVMPLALRLTGQSSDFIDQQIAWPMIHTLAILAIAGSALVLWLQYVPRRGGAARAAFVATALLAAAVQIGFALSL